LTISTSLFYEFRFQVSGFGFQFSGFGVWVRTKFGFRDPGSFFGFVDRFMEGKYLEKNPEERKLRAQIHVVVLRRLPNAPKLTGLYHAPRMSTQKSLLSGLG